MTTEERTPPEVIRIDSVSKSFAVRTDNSIKDRLVEVGRHREHRRRFQALDEVSLSIHAGTTVGLLGANGSGKSTLLKLIAGILAPDSGRVAHRGRIAALLELGAGFHPELSGRENIYLNAAILGLSKPETDERFDSIVQFSGIEDFIDRQVKFYSSGMYMRLAFAVAVHTDPDILLVDEVLAVGDEAFQRKCMDRIRQFQREGRTIVLVSHAASQISDVCDRTFVLSNGKLVFEGDVADGLSALRDVLEGRGVGESADDAAQGRDIEVIRIETLDSTGSPARMFTQGSEMTIRVHVRAQAPTETWTTGFSIDTPTGQMVLASNSERLGATAPPLAAGEIGAMDYRIRELRLGSGEYVINANGSPLIDVDTHVLWQGARFRILGHEENLGVVEAEIIASADGAGPRDPAARLVRED